MAYKVIDEEVWEDLKNEIFSQKNVSIRDIPKRLHVIQKKREEISNILDLHGDTLQLAFDKTMKFLSSHYHMGTKEVLIVTGRGSTGKGLIKKEFDGWIDNPEMKKYIRSYSWQNHGGAAKVILKKY